LIIARWWGVTLGGYHPFSLSVLSNAFSAGGKKDLVGAELAGAWVTASIWGTCWVWSMVFVLIKPALAVEPGGGVAGKFRVIVLPLLGIAVHSGHDFGP
jgi:hypothetical protein